MTKERRERIAAYKKRWVSKNWTRLKAEHAAKYRENRDAVLAKQREYYLANRDRIRARTRAYYEANRTEALRKQSIYAKQRRSEITAHSKRRRETDINFALRHRLRSRIASGLKFKNAKRCGKTEELAGCTIQFLKGFIEARFLPGMTWQNNREWHLDHIIPCAEFDLRDPIQQKQCFHYSNLKPLWAKDNLRKGKTRPASFQAELI
jgi:hypothetical protein